MLGLGSFPFARRYSGNHYLFSLPPGTKMFQFPGFPPHGLCVQPWVTHPSMRRVAPFGYLRVITLVCSSPQLFAACHVLRRLLVPRHPPCALCSLIFSFSRSFTEQDPASIAFRFAFFCLRLSLCAVFKVLIPTADIDCPQFWWAQVDSNHRPHAYQACALTS